jgi:hypothetical protein
MHIYTCICVDRESEIEVVDENVNVQTKNYICMHVCVRALLHAWVPKHLHAYTVCVNLAVVVVTVL